MLVTLKEILELAESLNCAIGSFNTPNLESILAVISAAEELKVPVIIQHAQVHEDIMPLSVIGPIMVEQAKKAKVPVCVHLDHGETLDYVYKAMETGFTSVMYDGSILPYEQNIANTKLVVSLAKKMNVSVEAELGSLGKRETGASPSPKTNDTSQEAVYTNPDQAKDFVERTGIDALACSFGTAHGLYAKEPKLDFSIVEGVRRKTNIPIVMHGGSGVSDSDFKIAIDKGVRKINYYTYMAKAGGEIVLDNANKVGCVPIEHRGKHYKLCFTLSETGNEEPVYYHDFVTLATNAMKENAVRAMKVFSLC